MFSGKGVRKCMLNFPARSKQGPEILQFTFSGPFRGGNLIFLSSHYLWSYEIPRFWYLTPASPQCMTFCLSISKILKWMNSWHWMGADNFYLFSMNIREYNSCMCVCACTCVHVCAHVCVCVRAHVHMCVSVYSLTGRCSWLCYDNFTPSVPLKLVSWDKYQDRKDSVLHSPGCYQINDCGICLFHEGCVTKWSQIWRICDNAWQPPCSWINTKEFPFIFPSSQSLDFSSAQPCKAGWEIWNLFAHLCLLSEFCVRWPHLRVLSGCWGAINLSRQPALLSSSTGHSLSICFGETKPPSSTLS